MFYFKQNREVPDMLNIHFDLRDSLYILKPSVNLVNPTPMNMGFLETFAGANAACKSNFDSLMIPFRCLASDVHKKKQVIFSDSTVQQATYS
jgi:NTE family protein